MELWDLSTIVMNHHVRRQVEEERVYLAYTSSLLFLIKGSQDRNLEAGADAEASAYWLAHKHHP